MRYRTARRISTGQGLNVLWTTTDRFSVPVAEHQTSVASAFALPVADVEMLESGVAPDLSGALSPVVAPVTEPWRTAARRLKQWATDPANPPPTRAVVLDILRVLVRWTQELE